MYRTIDIILSIIGLAIGIPLILIVCFLQSKPIYIQQRVGRHQRLFHLIKLRTMHIATKTAPSHMVEGKKITKLGKFLRSSKIDEIPQLINVLKGDMSLVGPRPCLPTQHELITYRAEKNIFSVRPGITGLSQVRGIDMSTPKELANSDYEMLRNFSIKMYIYCILNTFRKKALTDRVR